MVNIPYLIKALDTEKLSELVATIDLPPLDVNLAIWDAEKAGQIEVNEKKDKVKLLVAPEKTFNSDLANKLLRVMQKYESEEINVSRGYLNRLLKDPDNGLGYPYHEYVMALEYMIDIEQIEQVTVEVPEIKDKRPYHKFAFLQFPGNPNDDWNKKEVNKWIESFNKKK